MAPPVPVQFANNTSAANSATVVATVGTTTFQGAALVVACGSSGNDNATGVTDTQGNSYTLITQSVINENVQCFVALNAKPLTGGVDSITGTWSAVTTQQKNVLGIYVQGALSVDLSATNNGSSGTASVTGGTPGRYNELCLAIVQIANGGGGYNVTPGYTFFAGVFPSITTTAMFYANVQTPFAQSLTSTLPTSQQWAFLFISLIVTPVTIPAVPYITAGFGPQQADLATQWSTPLSLYQNRVVFRAIQAITATSLPSAGTITRVSLDTILEDPYSGWSAANNVWTPPTGVSGWFQATAGIWVVGPTTQNAILQVFAQGLSAAGNLAFGEALTAVSPAQGQACGAQGSAYAWLTGGIDSMGLAASIKNYGSALNTNLTAGQQSSLEIIWIGS